MKPTLDDLKRLLVAQPVPEPGEGARDRALRAALAEHRRLEAAAEEVKGREHAERLTGKQHGGGPAMRRLGYAIGGLALAGIAVAVILPNFLQFRMKSSGGGQQARAPYGAERAQEVFGGVVRAPMSPVPPPAAAPPPGATVRDFSRQGMRLAPAPRPAGGDRFEKFAENPVKDTGEESVSTFSVDVDTASYAIVRRALREGRLPERDAVRVEEMINYFDYDYPAPTDRTAPFQASVAVFPTPWNAGTKLLVVGLRSLEVRPSRRLRANLVFLVDVSGSMSSADKLPLLKSALRMLVQNLEPDDTVAIVTYAGHAETLLEPTPAQHQGRILAAIGALRAGGTTAGAEGLRRAYALAEESRDSEGVNRVILATDGDFNAGISNPEELKAYVAHKRETGISLTVLGFGKGNLNDTLMQKLAQNGNGNAAYIDSSAEAHKVLVEQLGATLVTVAEDVKVQVEFNPARVAEYRLIGYETRGLRREDFNDDRVDAGDVGAGHRVTALYEFSPPRVEGSPDDDLRYGERPRRVRPPAGDGGIEDEYAFLKIRYKLPGERESRLLQSPVSPAQEQRTLAAAPGEARFAAAVAAFGQLLRGDPRMRDFGCEDVIALARPVLGPDRDGRRAEFLDLVRLADAARGRRGSSVP